MSFTETTLVVRGDIDSTAANCLATSVANAATDLYKKLSNQGYDVILDDRKAGFGAKIKDSELIGIPMNIIIGKLYVEKNEIEMRTRDGQISLVQIDDLEVIFNHFK